MNVADGENSKQRQRAERILDAAAELVLRWGYKRVTIDEVARRAGIGKGTIYLHWRTSEALFLSMLARESLKMMDASLEAMRRDPAEILLSRMIRRTVLSLKEHPLLQALFTRDTEVLGNLVGESTARPLRSQKFAVSREYFALLRSHGLLRADLSPDAQFYAVNATVLGYYLMDPLLPAEERLPPDERADLIATTLRASFEPAQPPEAGALRELAPRVIEKFERLRADYAQFAQGRTPSMRESTRSEQT
jgi:AcrR family transcriptional regulator